jgi:hypothetical protein
MGEDRHKNSTGNSSDRGAAGERAAWRTPVITRFAFERTLHGGLSSGDGPSPHTD